jgi:BT1 family
MRLAVAMGTAVVHTDAYAYALLHHITYSIEQSTLMLLNACTAIATVLCRWGIGDLTFALGDDALAEFVMAVQFLPVCQMYISMCPEGTEGTTYAILTTLR